MDRRGSSKCGRAAMLTQSVMPVLFGLGALGLASAATAQGYTYDKSSTHSFVFAAAETNYQSLAFDASGDLFITDSSNNRIVEYKKNGTFSTFGSPGHGNGQLNIPGGVAVNSAGDVFVSDSGNNRIVEFSNSGSYLATIGSNLGGGNPSMASNEGIAFNKTTGNLYVAEGSALYNVGSRVLELSGSGTYLNQFGHPAGPSQLSGADSIVIDASGDLYVADTAGHIKEYDSSGAFIRQFGSPGSGAGQLNQLSIGLALDSYGDLWVADGSNNRIEEFSATGTYMTSFGTLGFSGGYKFFDPTAIAFDKSGDMFVVDRGNERVQEYFAPPTPEPGSLALLTCPALAGLYLARRRRAGK